MSEYRQQNNLYKSRPLPVNTWENQFWTILFIFSYNSPINSSPVSCKQQEIFIKCLFNLVPDDHYKQCLSYFNLKNVCSSKIMFFTFIVDLFNHVYTTQTYTQLQIINMLRLDTYTHGHVPPTTWGPSFWFILHTFSLYYPLFPDTITQNNILLFIKSIPYMIPCEDCKIHALQYINADSKLESTVLSKIYLFRFFVDFHNAVNMRFDKRQYTYEECLQIYA